MVENKLFSIMDEQFISYYGGHAYLISNGEQQLLQEEVKDEMGSLKNYWIYAEKMVVEY